MTVNWYISGLIFKDDEKIKHKEQLGPASHKIYSMFQPMLFLYYPVLFLW